jgi:Na+-transporting NADH:ubiquinone oxidoreductase subunit B
VRDGVDLKRIMITVWLAAFPAMFYGMYNLGHQANEILAATGGSVEGWRGALIAAAGGYDSRATCGTASSAACCTSCRST